MSTTSDTDTTGGTDLWRLPATTLTAMAKAGEVSVTEIVDAHLDRIAQVNPALNAVTVNLAEDARRAAADADRARSAGQPLGPMHGVPITVKEIYDVEGSATTLGVVAFAEMMPTADAPMIASLRQAGAIPIGRTNMPDFAIRWHTDNDLRGPTVNPWDPTRSPGGSSGGDAVAVATAMTPVGIGGDYGGSLRIPSSSCGVATLRTTPGRIPSAGSLPMPPPSITLQLFPADGPIARTVADVALAYEAMKSTSWLDPNSTNADEPADTDLPAVALTVDPSGLGVDPEVRDAVLRAADALSDAGYQVDEIEPPHLVDAHDGFRDLVATEVATLSLEAFDAFGSPGMNSFVRAMIEATDILDVTAYAARLAERFAHCRAWSVFLHEHPLVLGPVSTSLPFPVGYDIGGPGNVIEMLRAYRLTVAVNYLALPAAAVPVGTSHDGLPIGVQLIGRRFAEQRCLTAAQAIEDSLGLLTPIDPRPATSAGPTGER